MCKYSRKEKELEVDTVLQRTSLGMSLMCKFDEVAKSHLPMKPGAMRVHIKLNDLVAYGS